jgi:hypothetical protein
VWPKKFAVTAVIVISAFRFDGEGLVYAQTAAISGAAFVDLSVRALMATRSEDRRGGRAMFSQQLSLLVPEQKLEAAGALIGKLKTEETRTKIEIATTLGQLREPWNTKNPGVDVAFIYQRYLETSEDTLKNALDSALANAQGLYRDAIQAYNRDRVPDDLMEVAAKFTTVADKYVKSRYAENASFYLGQFYTKAFFLGHSKGKPLINESNAALERYIKRAESDEFVKTDFLAAAYFYRALNGLIINDTASTREWLTKGTQKFAERDDRIYIYQLFYANDRDTVLDKYLPARSLFRNALNFVSRNPSVSPERQKEFLEAIRQ